MKWMVTSQSDQKGAKIRTEIVCNIENQLFRGCTTKKAIQEAYEHFWNSEIGEYEVTVLGVEPLVQIIVSNG